MSATWFDHAIATVAPRMAARRVMARQAFETLTRGYDGAARGRRSHQTAKANARKARVKRTSFNAADSTWFIAYLQGARPPFRRRAG